MKRLLTRLLFGLLLFAPAFALAQEANIGSTLPLASRSMQAADGSSLTLGSLKGDQGTVVIFWSNTCPWVSKAEDRVLSLANTYAGRGFGFVLVNANDPVAFPDESGEANQQRATSANYGMPYVTDAGSELAVALGASRTPHIYVFDGSDALVYVGALDDSPGDPSNVTKTYLADALDAVIAGSPVPVAQTKAFGCTIKFQ